MNNISEEIIRTLIETADTSIGQNIFYISLAIFVIVVVIGWAVLILANYKHKSNSATWYKDQVYAYKVGFIQKKAKEEGIDLIYPPKTDLGKALEEEVSKDLSTP